jgi:hypothetical protein
MTRIHKAPRALALAAAVGLLLQAGQASAITLNQAYEAALNNDPTFLSAVQDAAAGREYRIIGRANLLPNVQANYSNSRNNTDVIDTIGGREVPSHPEYYSRNASVSLRQPLFAPQAWALYKQGAAQSDYNVAQFDSRVQEMILRVTGAYCDALFAQDQVRIATIQRDMYLEQGRVNDHLFAKGEGTKTDMLETQARLVPPGAVARGRYRRTASRRRAAKPRDRGPDFLHRGRQAGSGQGLRRPQAEAGHGAQLHQEQRRNDQHLQPAIDGAGGGDPVERAPVLGRPGQRDSAPVGRRVGKGAQPVADHDR